MNRISNGKMESGWPPVMQATILVVTTTAQTQTIAAPGAGFKIEVYATSILESLTAAFAYTAYAHLSFLTSAQRIVRGVVGVSPGVVFNQEQHITGVRVAGADNEALTLTNYGFGAGSAIVRVIVFHRIVPV